MHSVGFQLGRLKVSCVSGLGWGVVGESGRGRGGAFALNKRLSFTLFDCIPTMLRSVCILSRSLFFDCNYFKVFKNAVIIARQLLFCSSFIGL